MGDGRTIRPLGIAFNMNVKISGKCIPTDFFVIDAYHSNHDNIILGRPFLKLVDAVLDAGKGKVTMNLNGKKYTYNFFRVSKHLSSFPPEDGIEKVDSLCFVETLREPLQRAMENQVSDQQDEELDEATKGLEPQDGNVEGEKFEDLGEIKPEEPQVPEVDHQRRLTHAMREVVKKEVINLLDARIIYPVPHSEWVSP
jgi:hypothetical protein